jgi:replicative DNA helicase
MSDHRVQTEQAVIGAILLAGDSAYRKCAGLITRHDFSYEHNKIIFGLIEKCIEQKTPIDILTVSEKAAPEELEIIGGMEYLSETAKNTPSSSNILAYANVLGDLSKSRQLSKIGAEIISISGGDESSMEKVAKSHALVKKMSESVRNDDKSSKEAMKEFITWMKREESELKSGYFDKHTGGLFPGLIVIAAGTGQGKSTLALNIAYNLRQKNIAYYSLEMPSSQLIARSVSRAASIPFSNIRDSKMSDLQWQNFHHASTDIAQSNIRFVDRGVHINEICAHAISMESNKGLDLMIVDYIQLVKSDGQTREREIANITQKLKGLSMDLNIPIIALSQLSREHERRQNPRPALRDLRESGAIEQDSDLVMFLYDESRYKDNINPANEGLTELYADKFRHGDHFSIGLEKELSFYKFSVSSRVPIYNETSGIRI